MNFKIVYHTGAKLHSRRWYNQVIQATCKTEAQKKVLNLKVHRRVGRIRQDTRTRHRHTRSLTLKGLEVGMSLGVMTRTWDVILSLFDDCGGSHYLFL